MPDVEGEAEALHNEELRRDDILCCCVAGNTVGEMAQGHVIVVRLGGDEEGAWHDGLGMVGHGRVGEVEAAEVLDSSGLVSMNALAKGTIFQSYEKRGFAKTHTLTIVGNGGL